MRRYPQHGFSRPRRSASRRMERTVRGRPGRLGRDPAAWRRASRSRCQRSTVSGRTSNRNRPSTSLGRRCSRAARNAGHPGGTADGSCPATAPAPRSGGEAPGPPGSDQLIRPPRLIYSYSPGRMTFPAQAGRRALAAGRPVDAALVAGRSAAALPARDPRRAHRFTARHVGGILEASLLRTYRREHDVPLKELRDFIDWLRDEYRVPYLLADRRPMSALAVSC